MSRLKNLENKVKPILEEIPETRDSYELLYYVYAVKELGLGKKDILTYDNIFYGIEKDILSSFESVSRCARKIKEKEPSLLGEKMKKKIAEKVEEFRTYVRDF